jgi:hypothetical protein
MTSPPGARPDVIALTDAFDIPDRVLNSTLGRALAPAPAVLRDHPAQLVNSPSDLFKARARDLFHRGMQETTLPRARPLDARRRSSVLVCGRRRRQRVRGTAVGGAEVGAQRLR